MTYMSTPDDVAALLDAGDLQMLPSAMFGFETARTIYVSPNVMDAVCEPFPDGNLAERHSQFRQLLDSFLELGEFSVSEDPYCKPSDAMLARVDPVEEEIWDFRSTVPNPGIRCVGAFLGRDEFVALEWDYRENLEDAEAWKQLISDCAEEWKKLFSTRKPLCRSSLDDYLSHYYCV